MVGHDGAGGTVVAARNLMLATMLALGLDLSDPPPTRAQTTADRNRITQGDVSQDLRDSFDVGRDALTFRQRSLLLRSQVLSAEAPVRPVSLRVNLPFFYTSNVANASRDATEDAYGEPEVDVKWEGELAAFKISAESDLVFSRHVEVTDRDEDRLSFLVQGSLASSADGRVNAYVIYRPTLGFAPTLSDTRYTLHDVLGGLLLTAAAASLDIRAGYRLADPEQGDAILIEMVGKIAYPLSRAWSVAGGEKVTGTSYTHGPSREDVRSTTSLGVLWRPAWLPAKATLKVLGVAYIRNFSTRGESEFERWDVGSSFDWQF